MKKLLLSLIALAMIGGTSLFAQGKYGADSAECIKYLSYYKEYFKQKNYDASLPNWRKAYTLCPPTASQTMLIDGTTLMRYLIGKNSQNTIYRNALIDTLLSLHNTRAQYYSKYAVTAMNNKGTDIINYLKNDPKAQYDGFKEVIAANEEQVKPNILLFTINTAVDLYLSLFTPRFEENPDNLETVSSIVMMMASTEGCTDNDLFLQAATKMHQLDPSYQTAYFLYKLYNSKGDIDSAIKYMEEAIASPESDNLTDAAYYYELAVACSHAGNNAKAFKSALDAIDLDSSYAGKSYMLIGTIWGSQVCPGNEIEQRAPYWVAVDYLVKARNADPSLAEEANKLIGQYSTYFPQTAEAFMYNITDGDSYTVSCGGMRALTTVRTQE